MAEIITMPRLSDTMTEGKVSAWLKNVGDSVAEGDILAEIETDKAVQDFESEIKGTLLYQGVAAGASAPVDSVLAIIGNPGEDISGLLGGSSAPKVKEEKQPTETPQNKTKENTSSKVAELPKDVFIITMPRLSDTMTEGKVAEWNFQVGDDVKEGDILAEIETDKAVQEFESEYTGKLLYQGVTAGEAAPVDSILAIIGPEGTDVSGFLSQTGKQILEHKEENKANVAEDVLTASESQKESSVNTLHIPQGEHGERIFISPLAKKLAQEKGIDIKTIKGSGEHGRIVRKDIENYQPSATESKITAQSSTATAFFSGEDSVTPNTQVRNVIAKRLSESKYSAPHYYLFMEVNMDAAIEARKSMNTLPDVKISFNDMVIKAAAMALKKHPQINSSWKGDSILHHGAINIGVAVAIPDGLVVPVVKNADQKSFSQISAEVKDLAGKAKGKGLKVNEMEGSTFSISNLGMFGIESFTSIINQPNSCILSVGAIIEKPVVKNGQIVVGNTMKLSMACDHRVVDGATGAEFLQTLKQYLEQPMSMFV